MKSHPLIPLGIAFLITANAASVLAKPEKDFPVMDIGKPARGSAIITGLGSKISEVAQYYDMTQQDLGKLCLRDTNLRADRRGKLHYACQSAVAQAPGSGESGTAALLAYPSSQTFQLNSKPGLSRVIYLDFNGHTTSGTQWNTSYTAGAAITTPGYDIDGVPGSFSPAELANIQEIWQRVSEDFSAWDVNVTTAEPPLESLRKTTTTDAAFGIRIVIGGSSNDWLGSAAGGVAYLGSYAWETDTPAFIFPVQLGNGASKYVAEAISHETGHSLGLKHDGATGGTEYYAGHNSWAPIMGNSYYADTTQFSRGEYPGANNTEDDMTIINGYFPRSADAAGDDILTAVPLSGSTVATTGLIQSRTDADLYKVNAGAGTLRFDVTPATPEGNLNIMLGLYNGAGNLVTSSSPSTLGANLTTTVAAGTYYLAVDGAGSDMLNNTLSDYGSVGQFSLTGTVPTTVNLSPVAVTSQTTPVSGPAPLTVKFSSAGSSDPEGSALRYDWDFGNGVRSTLANPQYTYTTNGTYTASLVVFDSSGLSKASSVVISVQTAPKIVYVANIAMTKTTSSKGTTAKAVVTVKDATGAVKSAASVSGTWSGLYAKTVIVKTGTTGTASFSSVATTKAGTFYFKVNSITLSGFTYTPASNVETTDFIVK